MKDSASKSRKHEVPSSPTGGNLPHSPLRKADEQTFQFALWRAVGMAERLFPQHEPAHRENYGDCQDGRRDNRGPPDCPPRRPQGPAASRAAWRPGRLGACHLTMRR